MIAMISAEMITRSAFHPKNPNSKNVIGKFAHGDARRNAMTDDVLAPFL